ncbi:uncharacterized protein LOC144879366 [Branchiostoma floridae x Branchiostoma japonicum]
MRLFVVVALAVLALAESLPSKRGLGEDAKNTILGELEELVSAEKEEEALESKKKREEEEEAYDDFPLDVAFNGDGGAFLGLVLDPACAVWVVGAAQETGGYLAEGINIYDMAAYFFDEGNHWMMGYPMTTDEAIATVSCIYGADPPACSYDGTGCDISSYIDSLSGGDVAGYGMGMTEAISLVEPHIAEDFSIDSAAVYADAAADANAEYHEGQLVGYEEAVNGVSEALGVESPIPEEKKELAQKKGTKIAELLQQLRNVLRRRK